MLIHLSSLSSNSSLASKLVESSSLPPPGAPAPAPPAPPAAPEAAAAAAPFPFCNSMAAARRREKAREWMGGSPRNEGLWSPGTGGGGEGTGPCPPRSSLLPKGRACAGGEGDGPLGPALGWQRRGRPSAPGYAGERARAPVGTGEAAGPGGEGSPSWLLTLREAGKTLSYCLRRRAKEESCPEGGRRKPPWLLPPGLGSEVPSGPAPGRGGGSERYRGAPRTSVSLHHTGAAMVEGRGPGRLRATAGEGRDRGAPRRK